MTLNRHHHPQAAIQTIRKEAVAQIRAAVEALLRHRPPPLTRRVRKRRAKSQSQRSLSLSQRRRVKTKSRQKRSRRKRRRRNQRRARARSQRRRKMMATSQRGRRIRKTTARLICPVSANLSSRSARPMSSPLNLAACAVN